MANLSVIFNMVDNISKKMQGIGTEVGSVADSFQDVELAADSVLKAVVTDADKTSDSMQQFAEEMAQGMIESFQEIAQQSGMTEDEMRQTMGELPDFFRGIGDGIEESMSGIDDATEDTEREVEELGDTFEETGRRGEDSGDDMTNAMQGLESFLASAGIVAGLKKIAGALMECAEEAEKVETSYAKLQTIAGEGSMSMLTDEIRELSSETGIAVDVLADVAYNAISAGTAVEQSVSMAGTASKLATAGFTDTASALSVLTTAMNAYGDSAGTAMEIADSLITVQNLGVTTVADLSANMGKAIATASAYNVELDNLESAYISITKAGINTAEGTTYIASMLKELGTEGKGVAKVLEEETGQSFAQLMKSGYSLADVLGILYTACNEDATALMNLWGSAEAGKAANAIISQGLDQFNDNLIQLQQSCGATEKAYETMADTTAFAHTKMQNSMNNMKIAVGNALNPMLEGLYNAGSGIMDFIAKIAEKAPWLVTLITAGATAVGVLAVAVAGYTLVTKIATAAEAAYAAMLETTSGAMMLKVGLVGALTAALGILVFSIMSSIEAEEEMSATTEDMKGQLADLTTEYDEACEKFGETSAEAQELKGEMDELSESIEKNGQTLEEFYDSINEVCDAHDEIVKTFSSVREEAEKNQTASDNLINRLRELSTSADKSSKSQGEMEAIVKRLNQLYPSLGITIDDVNGGLDQMAEKINAVNSATKQAEYEAAQEAYASLIAEQTDLVNKQKEAEYQLQRAREKYANQGVVSGTWNELWGSGATADLDDAKAAYDRITAAVEDNAAQIEIAKGVMEEYQDIITGTSEAYVTEADAVSIAIANQKENIESLAEDYQKAYDAAYSSITGQWKLWEMVDQGIDGKVWDEAEKLQKVSLSKMQDNMDDQISYWEDYNANIESLNERHIAGLDDVVAAMNDGSKEASSYLSAMADASDEELSRIVASYKGIQEAQSVSLEDMKDGMQKQMQFWQEYADSLENLHGRNIQGLDALVASMDDGSKESAEYLKLMANASDEELSAMAKQYDSLQKAQQATADDMAELATDYEDRLAEIEANFADTVNNMNMESEAYNAAVATLQGYVNGIKYMQSYAESAAQAVSDAVTYRLNNTPTPTSHYTPPGHAEGTTFSEPFYLAGEEGPELIKSGGGDTVFPHSETEKILNALNDPYDNLNREVSPDSERKQIGEEVGIADNATSDSFYREEGGIYDNDFRHIEKLIESLDTPRENVSYGDTSTVAITDESNRSRNTYINESSQTSRSEKTITLNINGSGSIRVDQNADKEAIWDEVKDKIRDNLFEILVDEIYEGSDQSYEY